MIHLMKGSEFGVQGSGSLAETLNPEPEPSQTCPIIVGTFWPQPSEAHMPDIPLAQRKCKPIASGSKSLDASKVSEYLKSLNGWSYGNAEISRSFSFKNYYETIGFVNAVAWIANQQDHHPDMEVGYNKCVVKYSTHSVGGLSENDFICAARIDQLTS
jgi:4a-hydroxytetrahydrobiopterin dehydratase